MQFIPTSNEPGGSVFRIEKMNVYDFDKTIYKNDSTLCFYFFCLKRYPRIIRYIPKQIVALISYIIKNETKEKFKENFLGFIRYIPDIKKATDDFWNVEENNLSEWYKKNRQDSDIIISASPDFLVRAAMERLNINNVIATIVDEETGQFLTQNCYGQEKANRFRAEYPNEKIEEFYSDSYSDKPLADISQTAYLVQRQRILKWTESNKKVSFDFLELIRYGLVGGILSIANLLLFYLAVRTGISYLTANIGTYLIIIIISYVLNKRFVFERKTVNKKKSLMKIIDFFGIRICSIFFDSLFLWICVDLLGFSIIVSKICISIILICATYLGNKMFVFHG